MHGFHIKHDQVDDFLPLKIESEGKLTYTTHLLMLSLPTLRISPKTQIIFTTLLQQSLPSPNPLSDIAIRETEQTGNRDHLIS